MNKKNIFRGPQIQKGYGQRGAGLGGLFKKFMKWIVPLANKHVLPIIETGAKNIGNQIVNSASNFARDTIDGKNIKESASKRYNEAVDNLKQKAESFLQGEGIKKSIKRKRKEKNYIILKKQKKTSRAKDIFDNI